MKPFWEEDNNDDLVFFLRNKSYGAYNLRKLYNRHMSMGMGITLIFVTLTILLVKCEFKKDVEYDSELPSEVIYEVSTEIPQLEIPSSKPSTTPIEEIIEPESSDETFEVVKNETKEIKQEPKEEATQETKPLNDPEPTQSNGSGNGVVESVSNGTNGGPASDVIMRPDIMPKFPGGDMALGMFIQQNINYPLGARKEGLEGRVIVRFVINADGSISNIEVYRGIGSGCDEEAIRVVQKMPRWIPGSVKGSPVRVRFNLPINFKLEKKRSS